MVFRTLRRHQEVSLGSHSVEDGEKRLKGTWHFSAILEAVGFTLLMRFSKQSKWRNSFLILTQRCTKFTWNMQSPEKKKKRAWETGNPKLGLNTFFRSPCFKSFYLNLVSGMERAVKETDRENVKNSPNGFMKAQPPNVYPEDWRLHLVFKCNISNQI